VDGRHLPRAAQWALPGRFRELAHAHWGKKWQERSMCTAQHTPSPSLAMARKESLHSQLRHHPRWHHSTILTCSPGLNGGCPRYGQPAHRKASPNAQLPHADFGLVDSLPVLSVLALPVPAIAWTSARPHEQFLHALRAPVDGHASGTFFTCGRSQQKKKSIALNSLLSQISRAPRLLYFELS
jgi:hypothetical protein